MQCSTFHYYNCFQESKFVRGGRFWLFICRLAYCIDTLYLMAFFSYLFLMLGFLIIIIVIIIITIIVVIGLLALVRRVLWIRVNPSVHPSILSILLSGSFLGIDPLVFSETLYGVRNSYEVVRDSLIFFGKIPLH